MRKLIIIALIALVLSVDAQQKGRKQQQQQKKQQIKQPKEKTTDYYKVMGLDKGATDDQIKKAFKKQAIKYHPDKNPDDPEGAKAKFQEIANAYEVLSDPDKRRVYDMQGEEGVRNHEQQQGRQGGGANF
jgi:DnaJ family protein B protein 4